MKKSFSLIEVLVFITILSLFFIAAMTVATYSLKNMKSAEYKILASHLAEQGMEWMRSEKESNWNQFTARDLGGGTTYCLKNLNWNSPSACPDYSLGTPAIFQREVTVTNQAGTPVTSVDVEVDVSWYEQSNKITIPVKTVFSIWE
ncbi:hypothetical protein M1328_02955 [Patescibacteria group bacterium]|nr:hypothetical protein [Patescibacteria group bacterium]